MRTEVKSQKFVKLRQSAADKCHKFHSGFLIFEGTEHSTRCCNGILLFDSAHHHAHMASFGDDTDAMRLEILHDRLAYLMRHAFLHLKPAGKDLHDSGNFRKPDYPAFWNIGNM